MDLSDPKDLASLLEAFLLASGKPLSLERLGELFEEHERPSSAQLKKALEVLDKSCKGRAFELKEVASGYRLQVRQRFSPWVGRLWEERPQRYSRALLETLALIAYRQPITRGEIEDIRGVAVNSQIVKTLQEREWIRVVGHRDVPGRPAMFATTRQFLDHFNLKNLDELPPLSELKDIGELEPQLPLDGAPLPVSIASGDAVDGGQDASTPVADDDGDARADTDGGGHHDSAASDDAGEDTPPDDAGDDAGDTEEPQPQDDDAAASDQEDRAPSEQKQ